MRKYILIIIGLLIVTGAAWYYFIRNSSSPVAQTLNNILPFGSGEGVTAPSGSSGSSNSLATTSSAGVPTAHLFKISDQPVAGATAFVNRGGNLVVRYAERATGHIYDVNPVTLEKTEIVDTTRPKIYEADFKPDGSTVIFRTLPNDGDVVQSLSLSLTPPAGTSTSDLYSTKSVPLPANLAELAVGSSTIIYTQKGSPSVTQTLFDGSKPTIDLSSWFNQWRLSPVGDRSLVLTTKASSGVPGYSYSITGPAHTLTRLLGPLEGLVVTPNQNLTRIVYSTSGSEDHLIARNLTSGSEIEIFPSTLAEKCVWSAKVGAILYCGASSAGIGDGEPDQWYQGVTHFSDQIWTFNVDTNYASVIADPQKEFNVSIDAEHLFLSPKEDYLFFTNRNDLSLWALKLQ